MYTWFHDFVPFVTFWAMTVSFFFLVLTYSQMDSILRSLTLTLEWSWLEWGFWLAVNHWRRHLPLLRSLAGLYSCHWPEIDGLTSHSQERSHYRLIRSSPCSVSVGCILHSSNVKRWYCQRKGHFKVFLSFSSKLTTRLSKLIAHTHKLCSFICFQWIQLTFRIASFCVGNGQSSNGQSSHLIFILCYLSMHTCFVMWGHVFSSWVSFPSDLGCCRRPTIL